MKKLIYIVGILTVVGLGYAALNQWVFQNKSFATSEAAVGDTSTTYTLDYKPYANLFTSVTGTDSVKIKIYVDGYFGGKWDLNVLNDSLIVDNGTGDYARYTKLRGWGSLTFPYESFRVRNAISSGGSDDSSSALKYNQMIIAY